MDRMKMGTRCLLALLAGSAWALAFPGLSIRSFAWIFPGLLFGLSFGCSFKQRFLLGFLSGMASHLGSLFWLLYIPIDQQANLLLRSGPFLGWLALSAYLACYPAFWLVLLPSFFFPAPSLRSPLLVEKLVATTSGYRLLMVGLAAAAWVALEMIRARLLTGFPWNLLGASQYENPALISMAQWTGVYGVSFLLVFASCSLLVTLLQAVHQPTGRVWLANFAPALLLVSLALGLGARTLTKPSEQEFLKLVLIQPAVPQTAIWDPAENERRFQKLLEMSGQALSEKPDLMVWPEAAVPPMTRPIYQAISEFAASNSLALVIGADEADVTPESTNFYNSSFLVDRGGKFQIGYRKRLLVIFGEYVPLRGLFPFLNYLTPISGGFSAGKKAVVFEMKDPPAKWGVLICFEDNFPHLAREYAGEETDFLLNLTNDGWFGKGAAQWQHAANSVFRAVENGRPLVRCTNNGLTCWIDRQGRIRQIFRGKNGTVYEEGFLSVLIPRNGRMERTTFYNSHGDIFGWSCLVLTTLVLVRSRFTSRLPGFGLSK